MADRSIPQTPVPTCEPHIGAETLSQLDPRKNPDAALVADRTRLRVCLATHEIHGPAHNGGVGTAYTALAELLAAAGHDVTVLYLQGNHCERGTLDHWTDYYHRRGVTLVPLPPAEVPHGGAANLVRSYRAYQWLRSRTFDVIHFHEWLGAGYYSLLARRQGLAFGRSVLCVGVHSPSRWIKEASQTYLDHVDDLETDALERKCVELADAVWSPSRYLLDWLGDRRWRLPAETVVLPYLVPAPTLAAPRGDDWAGAVTELVFFGRLEVRKGLVLFCDAVDRLAAEAGAAAVTVSFLGKPAVVAGRDAVEYLRDRARRWPFVCQVLGGRDRREALDYLRRPGRLAVMPSLVDNAPFTVLECLQHDIPFLASHVGGIPELIAAADHDHVLFAPDAAALARHLGDALRHGARPVRPAVDAAANRRAWDEWHRGLVNAHRPASSPLRPAPLVSVCLVHHDRPELLGQAVASLRAQDYRRFEVVLVDDGSTRPEALAYLADLEQEFTANGWQVVRQENRYLGAARNLAAAAARGDYLLFMDDDNVARPHELSTLVGVAERTGADIVTTFMDLFEGPGPPGDGTAVLARWLFAGGDAAVAVARNCFGDANALVRRVAFRELGGFTEERGVTHEDWELFARAVLRGYRLEVVPEALFWYRLTPGSMIQTTSPYANSMRHLRPFLEDLPGLYHDLVLLAHGQAVRNLELEQAVARLTAERQHFRFRLADAVNAALRRLAPVHRNLCRAARFGEDLVRRWRKRHAPPPTVLATGRGQVS